MIRLPQSAVDRRTRVSSLMISRSCFSSRSSTSIVSAPCRTFSSSAMISSISLSAPLRCGPASFRFNRALRNSAAVMGTFFLPTSANTLFTSASLSPPPAAVKPLDSRSSNSQLIRRTIVLARRRTSSCRRSSVNNRCGVRSTSSSATASRLRRPALNTVTTAMAPTIHSTRKRFIRPHPPGP